MGLIFKKSTAQPAFTVAAAITGTTEATQTLTCAYTVVRARTANVTCRWYRHTVDDGTDPTGVLLGTGTTYTLTGTDVGNYIRAIVTAINPAGTVQSTTSYTAVITSGDPPEPPALVTPAAITGTADVGETLTVTYSFTGQDSVAIQWYSYSDENGTDPITLGTASTQALTESESGRWIGVTVTATNAVDSTVTSAVVAMAGVDPYAPIAPTQYAVPAYDISGLTQIQCNAGDDLQAKLNALQPGECLILEAGATWTGTYRVPRTNLGSTARATLETAMDPNFDAWAYIISSAMASLPAEGTRVSASDATNMPTIEASTFLNGSGVVQGRAPALGIDDGVAKLRVVGVEISTAYTQRNGKQVHLVSAGKDVNENSAFYGEEIIFDRCYIHGTTTGDHSDGIVMYKGCGKVAVIECLIDQFHSLEEAHAVHIYQTPGPVLVRNNELVAAGINVFICGNATLGTNLAVTPADITITKNLIRKRLEWKSSDASYAGINWVVKNFVESKGSDRVLVRGNVIRDGWSEEQPGQPWFCQNVGGTGVQDVDFRDNVCYRVGIIQMANPFDSGRGYGYRRLRFLNNLFALQATYDYMIGVSNTSSATGYAEYVTFKHNTFVRNSQPQGLLSISNSVAAPANINGFVFEDNLIMQGQYGIFANGLASGRDAPETHMTTYDFNNNVVVGGVSAQYSTTYDNWRNWYRPSGNSLVGYVDGSFNDLADFALSVSSPYKGAALDGSSDIGADISAIQAQINSSDDPFI